MPSPFRPDARRRSAAPGTPCRTESTAGRDLAIGFGGEEFVTVLPHARKRDMPVFGDQLRTGVAAGRIVRKACGEKPDSIGLSTGAAGIGPGETLEDLLHRAGKAPFPAGDGGPGRVAAAQQVSPGEPSAAAG